MDAPPQTFRRSKLPHIDAPGVFQAVTFRLADSLPAAKVQGGFNSEVHHSRCEVAQLFYLAAKAGK
ncbi:hypothetical protein [Dokdonella sp.]|uniref:hypothetical protein n=1 Tax=Dokdonella sp. TaxID=2291710 RepID=UPI0031C81327|nr:hypothetical protein [Dokdonella sp.]